MCNCTIIISIYDKLSNKWCIQALGVLDKSIFYALPWLQKVLFLQINYSESDLMRCPDIKSYHALSSHHPPNPLVMLFLCLDIDVKRDSERKEDICISKIRRYLAHSIPLDG